MKTPIISRERVARIVDRMASEVLERNRGATTLTIMGIKTKGTSLANEMAASIERIEGVRVPVHDLDVSTFRDDRDRAMETKDSETDTTVAGHDVILVDDVLYTGRTVRAALDAIVQYGRPNSIQLAVLIDRGHREYPVQPDYVGRCIPTKYKERVVVDVDEGFAVYVID